LWSLLLVLLLLLWSWHYCSFQGGTLPGHMTSSSTSIAGAGKGCASGGGSGFLFNRGRHDARRGSNGSSLRLILLLLPLLPLQGSRGRSGWGMIQQILLILAVELTSPIFPFDQCSWNIWKGHNLVPHTLVEALLEGSDVGDVVVSSISLKLFKLHNE